MNRKTKKDYSVITIPFYISVVVFVILFTGMLFGDAFSLPLQIGLGATKEQIKEASNVTLFQSIGWWWIIIFFIMFCMVFIMFKCLQYGSKDLFSIPNKKSY